MKYIKILVVVAIIILVVTTVVVEAQQHQQLPGIIKNGFRLCQDGMGESIINPTFRIPWSEVLEPSGNVEVTSSRTKSVLEVQSAVPIDPVPKASAKSASELKKELGQEKVASKNCPNGWVPSFGECPPEKWDPWGREKRPYQFREIVGIKLDKGVGNYGSPTFKANSTDP